MQLRSKLLSPRLRFLKARLRPFKRPMFWGSITVLSLAGLFAWEAWRHPEWLFETPDRNASNAVSQSPLSNEDSAVAADVDSLQLLLEELDSAATITPAAPSTQNNQQPQGFLSDYIKRSQEQNSSTTSTPNNLNQTPAPSITFNPLGTNPSSSLGFLNGTNMPGNGNAASSDLPGMSTTNPSGTMQIPTVAPTNALQTAIDRLNNTNPNSAPSSTSTNTPTTATNPATANNSVQSNPTPSGQVSQVPASVPLNTAGLGQVSQSASPYGGTTNYSNIPITAGGAPSYSPPVTNPGGYPVNSYTYLNPTTPMPPVPAAQPIAPVPVAPVSGTYYGQPSYQNYSVPGSAAVPGAAPPFGASGVQPSQVQPSAFSVPRQAPGRVLGGGQINTFSNP